MKTTIYPRGRTPIDKSLIYFLRKQAFYLRTIDKTHFPYILYMEILRTQSNIEEVWEICRIELEKEIENKKWNWENLLKMIKRNKKKKERNYVLRGEKSYIVMPNKGE